MKKTPLIPVVLLLITIVAAGLIGNSNVEEVGLEVADIPQLGSDFVDRNGRVPKSHTLEVLERPAGRWDVHWLMFDLPRATSEGVNPENIRVMIDGADITEEMGTKIKLVEEDPVYRLSITRYWEPGEYNVTIDVSDYAGNRGIYKSILIFT